MIKDLNIIDPLKITDEQCPVFVQSGDMRGIFGFGIRERTNSNFNHSMILHRQGHFVSQGWTYKEIPISRYMRKGIILKFWICKDIENKERNSILFKIRRELSLPWYRKMYDIPGVIGQFFGIRWFNIPSLNYCSERVSSKLKVLFENMYTHPTPEDIDAIFKTSPRMEVLGYWLNI